MLILEDFNDTWNYTFIIVVTIAICIGTLITIFEINKNKYSNRRRKRNNINKDTE